MDVKFAILRVTAVILAGYGISLVIMSIVLKLRGKPIKGIWIRYLIWFLIIPPLLFPLLYCRIMFQMIILLLSLLLFREYTNVVGLWKDRIYTAVCYAEIILCYVPVFLNRFGFFQVMPIYLIVLVLLVPIIRGEYEHMIQKSCLAMLGITYFGWFLSHLAFLRNPEEGVAYIFFLFLLVASNDASSYISGRIFGKTPLTSRLSPRKTNEGFIGGIVAVLILAFLLQPFTPHFTPLHRVLFGLVIAVGGTCGDLVMSFIKRDLGLKDFGKVLPGHGGLLDRFDSIIFVTPLFFHLVNFFYPVIKNS